MGMTGTTGDRGAVGAGHPDQPYTIHLVYGGWFMGMTDTTGERGAGRAGGYIGVDGGWFMGMTGTAGPAMPRMQVIPINDRPYTWFMEDGYGMKNRLMEDGLWG
jgi:hypothetical protein